MKTTLGNVSSGLTFASFIIFATQLATTLLQAIISYGALLFIDPFIIPADSYIERILELIFDHNQPLLGIVIVLFLSLYCYLLYKTTKAIRNNKKMLKWLIITLAGSTIMVTLGQNLALIAGVGAIIGLISTEAKND